MTHNAAEMGQREICIQKINRVNLQIILNKIPWDFEECKIIPMDPWISSHPWDSLHDISN